MVFHPILHHFMRFWLWLTTGMITKQWVAIHRKHHQVTDEISDPHSPKIYGIAKVLFGGWWLYGKAAQDAEFIEQYGKHTPNDDIERKLYSAHSKAGILLMLVINLLLFGLSGLLIWAVQMIWIPFFAAGVINGIGHYWGYRNTNTNDNSRNILPWGIIVGGEELHNNHHQDPASPKLSQKPWEFDIGWAWFKLFELMGWARLTR